MEHNHTSDHENMDDPKEYAKFFGVITILIAAAVFIGYFSESSSVKDVMRIFMGLFFVVLSTLKFINLDEFVTAYRRYDLIAKKNNAYAYIYPVIEFTLGILFLGDFDHVALPIFTAALMFISSIGVIKVLIEREHTIMCACMGAIIKLPVTRITLIEDIAMGVMALMLIVG